MLILLGWGLTTKSWLAQNSKPRARHACLCLPGTGTKGVSHTHGLSQDLCTGSSPAYLSHLPPICEPFLSVPTLSSPWEIIPSLSPGLIITCDTHTFAPTLTSPPARWSPPKPANSLGLTVTIDWSPRDQSSWQPPGDQDICLLPSASRELESKVCATTVSLATSSCGMP